MPRSALHFSAMALRLDTPVPNWRSVMSVLDHTIGKPVTAPDPMARPAAAADPLSRLRREIPFRFLLIPVISPILRVCFSHPPGRDGATEGTVCPPGPI